MTAPDNIKEDARLMAMRYLAQGLLTPESIKRAELISKGGKFFSEQPASQSNDKSEDPK